jgi:molybdopterin-guanine dinucleotide biosynthesis protein A
MTRGAIILCGGQSTRMGRDKNWLPFGPDVTMLQRVVRLVSEAVPAEQIVCVAAPDQSLPALPTGVRIAHDTQPHQGPLAGLAAGLNVVLESADVIFAVSCDAPLLVPAVITRMFDLLGDHQIVAPHDGERWHPLPAVYRTSILPQIEPLLAAGKLSLVALLETADTRSVSPEEFGDVDPKRTSLIACNTTADYEFVLANYIIGESN